MPTAARSSTRSRSDSAPVVSMSVIGSAAISTRVTGSSRAATCFLTARPKCSALAKKTGASKRKTSSPGTCRASGCRSTSWKPRRPSTRPSAVSYGRHERCTKAASDSTRAMAMPSSTPTSATPSSAASESTNSERRTRHSQSVSERSKRLRPAAITIAARAGCGQVRRQAVGEHQQHDDRQRADDADELALAAGSSRRPRCATSWR